MHHLIPSLAEVLAPLAPAFRKEVFDTFLTMTFGWLMCLGQRTLSRVWETTGRSAHEHHAPAFRLYSQAVWNWDEVMRLLLARLLPVFVPGTRVSVVVDDTLCHKRGAKVAFGGIFLDPVLSSRQHKNFRFANNWVLLGLIIAVPGRRERPFCIPLLWRLAEKRGDRPKKDHRTKPMLAAEMIRQLSDWLPERQLIVVADSAYIGQALLRDRPKNVTLIGPMCWKAALYELAPKVAGVLGARLPTPQQLLADDSTWAAYRSRFRLPNGSKRRLEAKWLDVVWPTVAGDEPVSLLLLRDPKGEWRSEALVCTDRTMLDHEILHRYCERWCVEVAIADAKGLLGFHDPCVWKAESVERAAPMAWFVGTVVILWYVTSGHQEPAAQRQRPWYHKKAVLTFSDMLASCRQAHWKQWCDGRDGCAATARPSEEQLAWLFEYLATAV